MPYVNRRDGREVETVDSADTAREASRLAREYNLADPSAVYYSSARPCRAWAAEEREAARPSRVEPARPVPAFLDSFAGLIPCLVTSATADGSGAIRLRVRYTGRRDNLPDAYKAGEIEERPAFRVVPRSAIRGRRGASPRVMPFAWAEAFPELRTLRHVTAAPAHDNARAAWGAEA